MKIGVTLPTLSADAAAVLRGARAAEEAGVGGVFCFDHLWPLGHPERPALALSPMLGAVAAATERIRLGSLVARIGLLPEAVVVQSLEGAVALAGERFIAGLGTGDDSSAPEHLRNGLPVLSVGDRAATLGRVVERLQGQGVECWVGAGGAAVNGVARRTGAVLNFWDVPPERIAAETARLGRPVTWGGPLPSSVGEAAERIRALEVAGASWVLWGWPSSLSLVVEAAGEAGVPLG